MDAEVASVMDVKRGKKLKKRPSLLSAEKVKRKHISASKLNRSRIVLGDEFDRWRSLMEDIGVKTVKWRSVCSTESQYGHIEHFNDVWHAAKNVGKKILHAGQKRGCGILLMWSRDIVDQFWYCCRQASTYAEFVSMWRSVLHHITNRHSWILSHGEGTNQCSHGPLSEEERNKPWLDPTVDAEALSALAGVVLDKRFLNRIHYLLNFRSTSEIEAFNQLILMYCAKRFPYSPPVYRIRNLLASLDHNMNTDRIVKRSKDGNILQQVLQQKVENGQCFL